MAEVQTDQGNLIVRHTYSNVSGSWVADGVILYDAGFNPVAKSFTVGSGTPRTVFEVEVVVASHGVSYSVEQDPGAGTSATVGTWFDSLPEYVRVLTWQAGPAAAGALSLDHFTSIWNVSHGPEAHAVSATDFAHMAHMSVTMDGQRLDAVPFAEFGMEPRGTLVGLALARAGMLAMDAETGPRVCQCLMLGPDTWIRSPVHFYMSGATYRNVVLIVADVEIHH